MKKRCGHKRKVWGTGLRIPKNIVHPGPEGQGKGAEQVFLDSSIDKRPKCDMIIR